MILILEILIFCALGICYFSAPHFISAPYLSVVIILVCTSYALLYVNNATKAFLRHTFLSNTNIFLLLFFVVCFQFPIDYILGNNVNFSRYFYSYRTINLSTTFSALCFVAFVIGFIISYEKHNPMHYLSNKKIEERRIPTSPVLVLMYILWVGFLIFLNIDYVNGGHGSVLINSISVACFGYFWRLNVIYLAIVLYNMRDKSRVSFMQAVKIHTKTYWIVVLLSALLFFMAHNRVYTFYILTPVLFYLISVTRIKTKPVYSLMVLGGAAVFLTLFKVFGLERMFSEGSLNASDYVMYDRFSSFSPFTSELAASVYSDSTLFYIWYTKGIVMPGSTLVIGVLRTFSGLVPLFFSITGLSVSTYQSASYVTAQMVSDYGLGSSVSSDLLVSLGFCGAIIVMFLFGRIASYGDRVLFGGNKNYKGILIGLCLSSQIVFVSRATLSDVISSILFVLLFSYIYLNVYKIKA